MQSIFMVARRLLLIHRHAKLARLSNHHKAILCGHALELGAAAAQFLKVESAMHVCGIAGAAVLLISILIHSGEA